jgi:ubiquinone/menaquinone biosynthesis C-methylase UbiE
LSLRSPEEAAVLARFARQYPQTQSAVMRSIERAICGCDYGGTSWTTKDEADWVAQLLELATGKRLLDLGAGSGWPGLYLARKTGCDVALVDIPAEALRLAAERASAEQLHSKVAAVVGDGATLPFSSGCFDAIGHSDVLCCLEAKVAVLSECRRVIRAKGRMVFSVISIAPCLSAADQSRAIAAGAPFKVVTSDYAEMLRCTGWKLVHRFDLTPAYADAVERRLAQEEANAEQLIELLGRAEFEETIERRRRTVQALNDGLLRRELLASLPVA